MNRTPIDLVRPTGAALADLFAVAPSEVAAVSSATDAAEPTGVAQAVATPQATVAAPSGFYARVARPVAEALLVLAVLPLALSIALPIALVNLAVFKDPRKILFRQERVGRDGRVFLINKFRTMRDSSKSAFDSWSGSSDAARVTRFGTFLRNSHLDELPQLVNVVRGDMSLIGPRPEMVEIERWAQNEVPGFGARLVVRPGITGHAQITQGYVGRCRTGYEKKLALGLDYLANFGPRQDLSILVGTLFWMAGRKGWRWQEQGAANEQANGSETPAPK
jgi:lipopolysaccharide/colanic/teichoic acid biosynthesis glycosyltransferase